MRLHLNRLDEAHDDYVPQFSTVENQRFDGAIVHVDNHHYVNCHFANCNFVYSGGPFAFYECELLAGFLSPAGSAQRTAELIALFEQNAEQTGWPG